MTKRCRVKVCCIQSVEEAHMAIDAGADALGFVSEMPSGPGPIPVREIRDIIVEVPQDIDTFLLTSAQDVETIIGQQRRCQPKTLQIVDELQIGTYADLRKALPGISIVQVLHVTSESIMDRAVDIAAQVDAILLDSGNPDAPVKELGGTGRTHDWEISRQLVDTVSCPVYLAGGLTPQNVAEAIGTVQPFGVDVCSGVRKNGKLDPEKLANFFLAIEK